MVKKSKIALFLFLLIFIANLAIAQDRYPFNNLSDTHRFNQLIQQFRCLVCQNEDLASSDAPLAADLRQQIYHQINTGKSDTEITAYLVNRYGNFVRFKPPLTLETLFIWALPFVLLALGGIIFYAVVRRKSP